MCNPAILAPLLGTAATATGATVAAVTGGGFLSTLGTIVSIGGALMQGIQGRQAADQQVALIEQQKTTEANLNATEDQRRREQFRMGMAQQRAELAARGVSLDSPTAVALGRTAAQEMSFDSQSVRSTGEARQAELTGSQMMARAQGQSSMLNGVFSAASGLLTAAPDLWPGFGREKVVA